MAYDPRKDPSRYAYAGEPSAPGRRVRTVTPNDDDDLAIYASALYVGTAGDVALIAEKDADNASVIFRNVPAGAILPVQTRRVLATGTTADDILAILS